MSKTNIKRIILLTFIIGVVIFPFMNIEVNALSSTLQPVADKFVDTEYSVLTPWDKGDPNYIPGRAIHWVGTDDTVPSIDAKSVMKFDLSSITGNISNAKLRICIPAADASPSGSSVFGITNLSIYQSSDDSWLDTTTAIPSYSTVVASDTIDSSDSGTWKEYDITSFINTQYAGDKVATIVMTGSPASGSNQFAYYCKEDSTNPPQLVVTFSNAAPTNINLSASTVVENSVIGTTIGNLTATDSDAGETFTFSLVAGYGDNASFSITDNQLKTNTTMDFETKSSYDIKVRVTDSASNIYEKSFAIAVTNVNETPTLTTITALNGATEDNAFTISYATLAGAANEADGDGGSPSFRVEAVSSGTLTKGGIPVIPGTTLLSSGESLVWTPAANANGTLNAFTVVAWDGSLASSPPVQVQVNVTSVNDAPTLTTITTFNGATEDTPFTISYATLAGAANEADVEGSTLSFRVEAVSSGTLTKGGNPVTPGTTLLSSGESLVWTPAANANGTLNAFTVVAWDGSLVSTPAVQVQVIVTSVNDAPTLTTITQLGGAIINTPYTISYATLAGVANEADVEGTTLSFRVEAVSGGTLTKGGISVTPGVTLLSSGESLVWTPPASTTGVLNAFTVVAWDGSLASSPAIQVQVNVSSVNVAPTLTAISTLNGATEDNAFTISYATLAGAANETDGNGDSLSFRVEAISSGTLTKSGSPVTPGTTLLSSGESLIWTPAANANGTLNAFTVVAWDGSLASSSPVQVQVNVTSVNDAPTMTSITALNGAIEDNAFTISYATLAGAADTNETDVDGDSLSFRVEAVSSGILTKGGSPVTPGITLLSSGEDLVWTPAADANGTLNAFTVVAWDGSLASSPPVQVRVNVASVNDTPTMTSITALNGATEDNAFTISYATLAGAANEADGDGDSLSFLVVAVSSGTLTKGGSPVTPGITLSSGESLVWTPAANANGTLNAFTVVAWDGSLASASPLQVQVNVASVNDTPTMTSITALNGATEDKAFTISYATLAGAANEVDVDGDSLSFRVEAVSSGTLTKGGSPVTPGVTLLSSGESLVWTPPASANGLLNAFKVVAWDGSLASSPAIQVQVNVDSLNVAPTISFINPIHGSMVNLSKGSTVIVDLINNGSGINTGSIQFQIDGGAWVSPTGLVATAQGYRVYYVITNINYAVTSHVITVQVTDLSGNLAQNSISFTMEAARNGFGFGKLRF